MIVMGTEKRAASFFLAATASMMLLEKEPAGCACGPPLGEWEGGGREAQDTAQGCEGQRGRRPVWWGKGGKPRKKELKRRAMKG